MLLADFFCCRIFEKKKQTVKISLHERKRKILQDLLEPFLHQTRRYYDGYRAKMCSSKSDLVGLSLEREQNLFLAAIEQLI